MSFYKYNDDGTPRYTFSSDYVSSGLSYNVTEEAAERRRFITGLLNIESLQFGSFSVWEFFGT